MRWFPAVASPRTLATSFGVGFHDRPLSPGGRPSIVRMTAARRGPERPRGRRRAKQGRPDDDRLQRQPGCMIPPGRRQARHLDPLDRVPDIGWEHAGRVKGQHDPRYSAKPRDQQAGRSSELAKARDQHDLAGHGHPKRHDRQESLGRPEMQEACRRIEGGESRSQERPCSWRREGFVVHVGSTCAGTSRFPPSRSALQGWPRSWRPRVDPAPTRS